MEEKNIQKYHSELFNHFGYNFGFVADLLDKFLQDKESVSDYWQNYFTNLLSGVPPSKESDKAAKVDQPVKSKEKPKSTKIQPSFEISPNDDLQLITGVGARIIENMDSSLSIPTATSLRTISVKLLEENRKIINHHLKRLNGGKLSFTHLVAYALVRALKEFPNINNSFAYNEDKPYKVIKKNINLGIAVDTVRKDGTRSLIVPNIKKAGSMNFKQFYAAYNDLITRTKEGKIEPADFQGTTITLTNPGGIGTVSSNPRLMTGQGAIIAIGAIDYPAEFKAMHQTALAKYGIGKVMNITSTYDHRIIQGAESGEFLKQVDNLFLGEADFYDRIFEDLEIPQKPVGWGFDTSSKKTAFSGDSERVEKQARILQLINMFRVRGHLIANLNPLSNRAMYHEELDPANYGFTIWDYDRQFLTDVLKGMETGTLRDILDLLHQTYCDKIGVEYMHIQNHEEKVWLQSKMEPVKNIPQFVPVEKKRIMEKLIISEAFEHFLHTRFIGHKRFSLEGSETLIPALDHLLGLAADDGSVEVFLGMAHRGRLNVLSNIIGKTYEKIFSEFEEEIDPDSPQGTGDVKYHLGASGTYETYNGKKIKVSVASNPSHLEWVNPVVEGIVRAKLTRSGDAEGDSIVPVLIHGDAAFAGQGIVAETLNLSQLKGYRTGGTIHVIINNQIGFTTSPKDARSSPYPTDVAKMVQAPIFHVNGDDPEATLWVVKLAFEYRQRYNKDVVIDMYGYRRHGHNEGDDPVYTQPVMYKAIKSHPSVKEIFEKKLIAEKILTEKEIKGLDKSIYSSLDQSLKDSKKRSIKMVTDLPYAYPKEEYEKTKYVDETKVSYEVLAEVVRGITRFPDDFTLNPKLKKHIDKRKELLTGNARIDWAFGEALAFGTLLLDGRPVRLSGQDSARGTFSQRHLILSELNTGEEVIPHNMIRSDQALLEPLDSLLSEAAVLGFEFGYSVSDPLAIVIWEAQFGDFANSAQVIIDNFIAASKTKWHLPNQLVMLLPHGQEGQGPEHSSARLERFLILCAEDNMTICNPTTPAQYFHLLRRQAMNKIDRPLIVMTPKSLLRLPAARSPINDFTDGKFQEVIDDSEISNKTDVLKVILTSGKVYYDLIKYRDANQIKDTAIVRVEQYYPYSADLISEIVQSYGNAKKVYWVQEEPKNMGAWSFMFPRLIDDLGKKQKLSYIGRDDSPSPASGSSKIFLQTQEKLIKAAFS
ncbi:MAG: multifunctional oxoglutarate decarboxylase/oxoglutarate dehydrogenase thiamine pyrophosphate-binding subunit/dihydrolipoyllysine-residue succinyltransferase subunit [Melioribacteraceae bacterium]|nr:multifunctional oxoglutarate decarboxylase/oxoglutarate dehydrogenase thiamine pyrophosphate-binding subunit/dihydrolipoyllysine-residue succinyltransferase subunit [Melioribacteraceae bacterium]MCF8355321.1 multifunctional oxoglutarate decarboxylase/oxoglutarate dehydrogenase thiamine pyrophosphate-binding subunit/dihydrolipoyllysine-residue succinyltransferase subunit [Melioribacteraceae bacterium]MCF8395706.1 multifunctional oxoglutarate decarboxylase/oxoglutarate dehydrogenase thiamine pyr